MGVNCNTEVLEVRAILSQDPSGCVNKSETYKFEYIIASFSTLPACMTLKLELDGPDKLYESMVL